MTYGRLRKVPHRREGQKVVTWPRMQKHADVDAPTIRRKYKSQQHICPHLLKQDHVEPAFLVAWRSQQAPKDTPKDRKSDARPALKHQLDTQKGARTLHKTQGVPKRTPRTHKIIKYFLVRKNVECQIFEKESKKSGKYWKRSVKSAPKGSLGAKETTNRD